MTSLSIRTMNTDSQHKTSTHPLNTHSQPLSELALTSPPSQLPFTTLSTLSIHCIISEEDDDPDWAFGLDDADDPDALYAPSDDDEENEMNALYDMNQQASVSNDDMVWEVGRRRMEERRRKRTQRDDDVGGTKGDPPVATHSYIPLSPPMPKFRHRGASTCVSPLLILTRIYPLHMCLPPVTSHYYTPSTCDI